MRLLTILGILPRMAYLGTQLLWFWMTLDWKVRKTRRAFERELVKHGISKEDARQLSKHIKTAKDDIVNSLWKMAAHSQVSARVKKADDF